MPEYTFDKINHYSKYISSTEDKLCHRTLEKIKNILLNSGFATSNSRSHEDDEGLKYSYSLKDAKGNEFTFLVQGSYANGTCIRQDSDVDIAIISESTFRGKYRSGVSASNYGFVDSSFNVVQFKYELADILQKNGFKPKVGNKCINVDFPENSKKNFDIVPCLRYRDYSNDYWCNQNNYEAGTLIRTNKGEDIINYPEQSCRENINKNNSTNYYYKKVVRILKNIKSDMEEDGIQVISSFELESLISNVPNIYFQKLPCVDNQEQLKYISQEVLGYIIESINLIDGWLETNKILSIYSNKNRNIEQTKNFLRKMYDYYN